MSGGELPYHLRPNKAVERLVFCDLLRILDVSLRLRISYEYFGFGGPQMEDFKLLNDLFPQMQMTSIEVTPEVSRRQRFNGPHSNIRYRRLSSGDFVARFACKKPAIVWLDFTSPDRAEQVSEFQHLLRELNELSIVKITLNAAPSTLGGDPNSSSIHRARRELFLESFDRCFPNGLPEEGVSTANFPKSLLKILEHASAEVFKDRPSWRFRPLTSAVYKDGQQMLTLTGIVGDDINVTNQLIACELGSWPFFRPVWSDPVEIEVPELTLKERICINQLLPKHQQTINKIQKRLGIHVGKNAAESERRLTKYAFFQRYYPHFGRIAV